MHSNNPAVAVPALSMEFAAMCLSNALSLLPPDPLDVTQVAATDDADGRWVLLLCRSLFCTVLFEEGNKLVCVCLCVCVCVCVMWTQNVIFKAR